MKAFLAMAIFGVILYLASSCDVNNKGRHWYNNGKINKFCYEHVQKVLLKDF